MRRTLAALLVGAVLGGTATVHASTTAQRYTATVRDRGTLTEDDAAHLRLVTFERHDDGTVRLVYRTGR